MDTRLAENRLAYVMEYLREEWEREKAYHMGAEAEPSYVQDWITVRVNDALDAYAGGAR